MEQLSTEERLLVDALLECIAEAMSRLEDVDPAYANKTKLQKLLYLAINEYDIPVSYSWYLAGAVLPGEQATPGDLQSTISTLPETDSPTIRDTADDSQSEQDARSVDADSTDAGDVTPEELVGAEDNDEMDSSSRPVDSLNDSNSGVDPILFPGSSATSPESEPSEQTTVLADRRDEIVDFYVETIPDVWHQNTMRFLQNFYLEHAPPEYRDLYVQSTHLRTRLRDIEEAVEARLNGEQPDRPIQDAVEAAGLDISDLHCTIRSSDSLSQTFEGFVRGTDLIEDGLMMVAQASPDNLEWDHLAVLKTMQQFFYYYVWRYPSLIISRETATGPSAETLKRSRTDRLARFEEELQGRADRFEEELAEADLKPDYSDYDFDDDELDEKIGELSDHYLEQ